MGRFEIVPDGSGVVRLSALDPPTLPLSAHAPVSIALAGQSNEGVVLQASAREGVYTHIEWSVSDGAIAALADGRARWSVPEAAGLYQAEVVVHFGDDGFAVDTLTLERKNSGSLG